MSMFVTPARLARSVSTFRLTLKRSSPQLSRTLVTVGMSRSTFRTRSAAARSVSLSSPERRIATGSPTESPFSSCRTSMRAFATSLETRLWM